MAVMDFSPLASLGQRFISGYDSGRRINAGDLLSEELGKAKPDYRKASGYAFQGGDAGSAIGLLGLGQKADELNLSRASATRASQVFADMDGSGAQPSQGLASLGSPAPSIAGLGGANAGGNGAPPGLIGSESGGNWSAQNDAVGSGGKRGHFGRIQFAQDRLQDAINAGVLPKGTTPQQFMGSSELQQQAERWHWADINKYIADNGFDRLVGQSINGVPVTTDGMMAVAHLGGKDGLRQFLTSGGRYNPADTNGTRLSDYFARMGGNGGPSQQPIQTASVKVRLAYGSPALREKIKALVPDGQARTQFNEFMRREAQMTQTNRVTGGSPTAERLADDADTSGMIGEVGKAIVQAGTGRFSSAIKTAFTAMKQVSPEMRGRVMNEARRVLYDPNPETVRSFMQRLDQIEMKASTRSQVPNAISSGLPRGLQMSIQGQ